MVRLAGFEPAAIRLEGGCSIQLSYRRIIINRRVKTNILKHTAKRQLPTDLLNDFNQSNQPFI